ncbi:hypothetical protein ACEWY4_006130 [Coilia grayii]|uniref:DDE Tnp4 domain-containing protein n=1 Tax=Coilia grayii TaxID=363190 RepID=A0ABD1KCU4_9TELE
MGSSQGFDANVATINRSHVLTEGPMPSKSGKAIAYLPQFFRSGWHPDGALHHLEKISENTEGTPVSEEGNGESGADVDADVNEHSEFHRLVRGLRLDKERFQRYFRLDREQFDSLLSKIGSLLSMQSTNYQLPISPAERLAICLRFLATGDSYRTVAYSYRVGVSMAASVVRQNYKGTYSVVLLAVVDAEYCFRVVDVGAYGRTSDGGVLANSTFGQKLQDGTLGLPQAWPSLEGSLAAAGSLITGCPMRG